MRPQWKERALAIGLGPRRLEAVLDRVLPDAGRGAEETDLRLGRETAAEVLGPRHGAITRRDVVRALGRSLADGAPARRVEEAADRLLAEMRPESGQRGERDAPGHERAADTDFRRAELERSQLSRLLAGRGIGLDRSAADRHPDVGFGLG